jgi:hypothetical protein
VGLTTLHRDKLICYEETTGASDLGELLDEPSGSIKCWGGLLSNAQLHRVSYFVSLANETGNLLVFKIMLFVLY